jgi:hypothetical protein
VLCRRDNRARPRKGQHNARLIAAEKELIQFVTDNLAMRNKRFSDDFRRPECSSPQRGDDRKSARNEVLLERHWVSALPPVTTDDRLFPSI